MSPTLLAVLVAASQNNTVENLLVAAAVIGFIALCGKGLFWVTLAVFMIWLICRS